MNRSFGHRSFCDGSVRSLLLTNPNDHARSVSHLGENQNPVRRDEEDEDPHEAEMPDPRRVISLKEPSSQWTCIGL